jgi:O-antigen/teichoic acid export membrane protein
VHVAIAHAAERRDDFVRRRHFRRGRQEFRRLNLIRLTMGMLSYLGPLGVSMLWPRLAPVVLAVVVMRIVGVALHMRACRQSFGSVLRLQRPDKAVLAGLFALGGWMSVSNIVGPLLTYLDRFFIAQALPIEQVAYYATPYDLITRTLVLPYALMAVIFPALAALGPADPAAPRTEQLTRMYATSVRVLWVLMWPVCFTAIVLARPILELWLGATFADAGTLVLQFLAAGVFINTLAQAPANLIQASGAPKAMALLHLVELPLFVGVLWLMVHRHGITGAAIAWAGRAAVDAAMLYWLAYSRSSGVGMPARWWTGASAFCTLCLAGALSTNGGTLFAAWGAGLLAFATFAWFAMLDRDDRHWVENRLRLRLRGR